ncbi:MAG: metal-dependent transcriptional regulator [Planctomycetes bacterium]|nr:metal-dependent transcriptional regulator [Planctomycetota bacterium]
MVEISQSKEDYLKAIWEAKQSGSPVLRARLAEELGVSAPAVTAALGRLEQAGLIEQGADGRVELTSGGKELVEHLILRHNLVEKLLVEVLDLEWYKAHEEAERIEHVISPDVEAKLLALFGHEGNCPHGAPLRGESHEERRRRGLVLLAEAQVGSSVRIARVFERDSEFLRYLDGRGIVPGAIVRIEDRSYDQVLRVRIGEDEVHMASTAAERIWVEQISGSV